MYAVIVALAYVSLVEFFFSSFRVIYYFLHSRNWSSIDICVYFNSLLLNQRLFEHISCSFMYLPHANSEEYAVSRHEFFAIEPIMEALRMHARSCSSIGTHLF